jgi:alkanesulfonate monooxygenase SsuD/methylene tetrahydromethanopterin reductase-like flavin-dependent oxidoreductase (luciferase family)
VAAVLDVGVILPSVDVQRRDDLTIATAARHAEDIGLDSVWHGDHLTTGTDVLDCTVALAAAAAVTERVRVGASVFVPALRPLAWAAKQVGSLVWVSGARLVLGVGSGGGPTQWAAAGVPFGKRGRRTDTALRLLPELLRGRPAKLVEEPGPPAVTLGPAVTVPPLWIGNASAPAIRRAASLGDGWFPSLIRPDELAVGAARLREQRPAGRPHATICIGATGALGNGTHEADAPTQAQLAADIADAYRRPLDEVRDVPLTGLPAAVAERLARYAEAGAHHAVVGLAGGRWRQQCDLLAEVRALLQSNRPAA